MFDRILKACRLDTEVYVEATNDVPKYYDVLCILAVSSLAVGIGTLPQYGVGGLILGSIFTLLGWLAWLCVTYVLAITISGGTFTQRGYFQFFRVAAYSASPGIIRFLGAIQFLYAFINLVALVWMLITMVQATNHVFKLQTTWKTLPLVMVGWTIQLAFLLAFFLLSNSAN
jgi:hypothetical protein